MKRILSIFIIIGLLISSVGCDKKLQDLNVNKVSPTALDAALMLNQAVINFSFPFKTLVFDIGAVQQIITPNGGVVAGANYNQDNRDVTTPPIWAIYYQGVIKNTHDAIVKTKDVTSRVNLYNMARIFQAYTFMVLTDEYGDIPYFEGGTGFTALDFFPKYDKQEDIYTDIIKELKEASAALDPAGNIEASDLLYAGNVAKWKKLANSLLLRAGMRLIKVDAARAQSVAAAAIAAGVITDNTDDAYIRHDANFTNPLGNGLNGSEAANFYLTKPFVDRLKNTNDPRLPAIAVRYVGVTSGNGQTAVAGNTTASVQIGMPMGYDNGTVVAQATADGLKSFYEYSQADRRRILKINSPMFLVTASQNLLLIAEARFRNWITTGTAAQYFSDGIKAHMDQLALYDPGCTVTPAARDAYAGNNPLNPGTELDQINTQYWISSFLNGPEAFANFRRTGFPALAPNPYGQPGNPDVPNGTFIRRLTYPTSEIAVNNTNYKDVVTRQGPDKLSTRVWWDK